MRVQLSPLVPKLKAGPKGWTLSGMNQVLSIWGPFVTGLIPWLPRMTVRGSSLISYKSGLKRRGWLLGLVAPGRGSEFCFTCELAPVYLYMRSLHEKTDA